MLAPALDPDALRDALEAAGWRCTPQRLAVYDRLSRSDHHPTAEAVYQAVKATIPNISLATVYKALEALVASGLATKLTAGDGSARYDARSDHHYHLRCLRSGAVQDLPTPFDPDLITKIDPDLVQRLERQGFRMTGYRLELVGYFDQGGDGPAPDRGAPE
jgi:Fe2+ or Zn2+ uptake regulation protein